MSTSPFVVIFTEQPQIVGPFPSDKNALIFGQTWQHLHDDDPRWQAVEVEDSYWENNDVVRRPYDPAEEVQERTSDGPAFTVQQIVDQVPMMITGPEAPPFLDMLIARALLSFEKTLGDRARLFCLFEYDDVPALYQDQENAGTSKVLWKWDLGADGGGTIHSALFGNDWRGLVITLCGGRTNDQTIYVIPQHAMDELSK